MKTHAKLRPLSKALAKKSQNELNENPDRIQEDLETLRAWLAKQQHLKARQSDQFLIAFLRSSKFSLEKAKSKIECFYTLRNLMPELFRNRDSNDPKTISILKLGATLSLPRPIAEDGPRLALFRLGCFDLHKYTVIEILKTGIMIAETLLYEDDNAVVAGYVVIMDMANVTPYQIFHFDPVFVKKISIVCNKALPSRMKGFHFINVHPSFEKLFNMVKSVISEKLKSRFYVHGNNMEELFKQVPQKCLPQEYGGDSGTVQDTIDYWEKKIKQWSNFYKEEDQYGTIENLRTGKPIDANELFGIDGSFRKLNVD